MAVCGHATSVVILLNSPNGDMGTSHVFTQSGVKITAYSYAISGPRPDLYGKNSGPGETGLGLTNDPDHEINTSDFVQMDFADPLALKMAVAEFQMGSVQSGEGWALYGSNQLGSLGDKLMASTSEALLTVPDWGSYRYYSWTATAKNVVLGEIVLTKNDVTTATSTPEPGTMAATAGALIGLSMMIRRLRRG
jgi:hypothetical protein